MAKKADVKYITLKKVESGIVNKPSVQTMAKIAKGLGISIEELIKKIKEKTMKKRSNQQI